MIVRSLNWSIIALTSYRSHQNQSSAREIDMKTKRNKEYYLRRAIQGFKVLIIYQCVTRPQYDSAYKDSNGQFSKDKMFEEVNFFQRWSKMGSYEKKRNARLYAKYSKHHNLAFGLDCRLVEKILGLYRNDNGKQERIHIDEVVQKLKDDGWLRWSGSGTKTKQNEHGKAEVVCWWKKKYFISNKDYWLRLLSDPKYSDYTKYPLDEEGFTIRAVEIIAKYRKRTIPQKVEPKETKYSSLKDLVHDFMTSKISNELFASVAHGQFSTSVEQIAQAILYKQGLPDNEQTNTKDETRTHIQDKQG